MTRTSTRGFRLLLAVAILSSCIGCDQATKRLASEWLGNRPVQSFLGDTVRLQYALNPGGFLSLGTSLPPSARFWLFVGFNGAMMGAVGGFLILRWNTRLAVFVSLAFVLAGGIGNLIDRTTQNGLVTDFLNVGVGAVRSGIFNVADVAVSFGAIALLVCTRNRSDAEQDLATQQSKTS